LLFEGNIKVHERAAEPIKAETLSSDIQRIRCFILGKEKAQVLWNCHYQRGVEVEYDSLGDYCSEVVKERSKVEEVVV